MTDLELNLLTVLASLAIGLFAGGLGGMAGIGGSMIILPALHIVFGEPVDRPQIHHVYMAAAMLVNVAVAMPSALTHYKAGAVRTKLLRVLLPVTTAAMLTGVLVSNAIDGERLRVLLGSFLLAYCCWSVWVLSGKTRRAADDADHHDREKASVPRLVAAGVGTGGVGGLLGLGGGVVMVPVLQILCGVKLRNAVATSSAVICVTAVFGAGLKLATLGTVGGADGGGESWQDAVMLAVAMAPGAIVGARIGATLTHKLPVSVVRAVITLLIGVAAVKLLVPKDAEQDAPPPLPPTPGVTANATHPDSNH